MLHNRLTVGPSPHIHGEDTIARIMWSVAVALIPAFMMGVANFGLYAALIVIVSIVAALATEHLINRIRGLPSAIGDGSACVTAILLAFTLPPNVPLYVPAIGAIFAIGIVKQAFGGLGCNIWNPALAARVFLMVSYPSLFFMPKWPENSSIFGSVFSVDAVTRATPCSIFKYHHADFFSHYSIKELFIGSVPGSIGETSAAALLIGAIFLMTRRYINWRLPLALVSTVFVAALLLPIPEFMPWRGGLIDAPMLTLKFALAYILSGGLLLGALFMATDMVTSPLTAKGQWIYGIGCGLLTAIIRFYGGYPEGVCYAILIMNTFVWFIDKHSMPRRYGVARKAGANRTERL